MMLEIQTRQFSRSVYHEIFLIWHYTNQIHWVDHKRRPCLFHSATCVWRTCSINSRPIPRAIYQNETDCLQIIKCPGNFPSNKVDIIEIYPFSSPPNGITFRFVVRIAYVDLNGKEQCSRFIETGDSMIIINVRYFLCENMHAGGYMR